jgi:tetratricopeptide (TPR) repeat protein
MVQGSIVLNLKSGKSAFNQGNYSKALSHYRNVVKLDKSNSEAKKGEKDSLAKLQDQISKKFTDGVNSYNNKKYRDAVKKFEAVLEMDKEYSPAIEYLEKAQAEFENNKVAITIEEYNDSGRDHLQNRNYRQAKEFFNKVLGLDPKNEEAREGLKKCNIGIKSLEKQEAIAKIVGEGTMLFRRKKYNEAIAKFESAKEVDPENQQINDYIAFAKKAKAESENKYYNDGERFYKEGNLLKAKENFEKALEANANNSKIKNRLAEVNSGIFEKVNAAKSLGKDNFIKGNYDIALAKFTEILTFDPENDEIQDFHRDTTVIQGHIVSAKESMGKGLYGEAIDSYNEVLKLNAGDRTVVQLKNEAAAKGKRQESKWFNDGVSLFEKGDLIKAEKQFSRVLSINPNHSEAKNNLSKVTAAIDKKAGSNYKTGLAYYDRKDWKSAISSFNKVLEYKSKYKNTSILLSKARKEYAIQTSGVREKNKKKVDSYLHEGIALYKQDKLQDAIDVWTKILRIDPNHAKAKKYINRAKYKLKELEKLK